MTSKEHRVKCGRIKPRSAQWERKARDLIADRSGLDLAGVLAMHDHLADLLEWEGADRATAEHYAWEQCLSIFTRSAA